VRIGFYVENGRPTLLGAGGLMLTQDERGWFTVQSQIKVYYVERRRIIHSGNVFKLGSQVESKKFKKEK
jgi:hypothetical protein